MSTEKEAGSSSVASQAIGKFESRREVALKTKGDVIAALAAHSSTPESAAESSTATAKGKGENTNLLEESKQRSKDVIAGARSLLVVTVLGMACIVAFSSRLFAVIRFESIIHEFDPW